jgi:hypothetical protein
MDDNHVAADNVLEEDNGAVVVDNFFPRFGAFLDTM